jgi:hypothetical protein
MGSFINVTDVDLLEGVLRTQEPRSRQGQRSEEEREQFNTSSEVTQRFQPLSELGGELIERFTEIDRLQQEINTRQEADEQLGQLVELLQNPTEENLAAAEDVRKDLEELTFTNASGESQQVISDEDLNRIRFDIPGETLERLRSIIKENSGSTEDARLQVRNEQESLQEFIENQGVQTGQTFTSQAEVITSFINVDVTGQLLDIVL